MIGLFNQLNAQGSVIRTAVQGKALRNEIITNNIANADTPGFRAKRVDFEDSLAQAIGNYPLPSNRIVDLSGVTKTVALRDHDTFFRLDGNNVDIEREMVMLYQNSMKYETLISSLIVNSGRLSTIFQGGR